MIFISGLMLSLYFKNRIPDMDQNSYEFETFIAVCVPFRDRGVFENCDWLSFLLRNVIGLAVPNPCRNRDCTVSVPFFGHLIG